MSKLQPGPEALAAHARPTNASLSGFLIGTEAVRRGHVDLVRRAIVEKGYAILLERPTDSRARAWMKEQGREDADGIASILIAYDLLPLGSAEGRQVEGTAGRNARDGIATSAAAKEVKRLCPRYLSYTPVFALETQSEAWSLLEALAPDEVDAAHQTIAEAAAAFATPPPVRDLSSVACRAKVELIDFQGRPAVRKTFRPGAERYLARELEVFDELGPHCDAIPKLLDRGPDHLVMEYIDEADQLGLPRGESLIPLPLRHVRELAAFLHTCVGHGFDPVDFKPDGNAIYTRTGLRVIDYEFWRRCSPGTQPEDSFCLAGLPRDDEADRPMGLMAPFDPYPTKWIVFTGLPVRSFLYDPPWLQRLKRAPWPAIAAIRRAARFASRRLGREARAAPTGRQSA